MSDYARVGGVTVAELRKIEQQFLSDVDWTLAVTQDELEEYRATFERHPDWASHVRPPTAPRAAQRGAAAEGRAVTE
eukprot:gene16522-18339_t